MRNKFPGVTSLLAVVAGCTVGPDYKPPEVKVPAGFASAPGAVVMTTRPSTATATASDRQTDLTLWWKSFDDPQLDALIDRAAAGNLDIKQALARLRQARAQLGVEFANLLPTFDANGSVDRSRTSKSLSNNQRFSSQTEGTLWRGGLDASWEIDIFGGQRRQVEAATRDIDAASEDRNAVLTSVLAEVGRNYVLLRGTQQRIRIARDNIASQKQTLSLNEARFNAGVSSEFDVSRARAQVATFEATVPQLQIQEAAALHRIGVLLGEAPAALALELTPPKQIPMALPDVPVGLPSDLLRRRPDIRRAERQLAAATARIGVATADLLPRFTLTGSLGSQASKFARIGDARSIFYSVGPAVSWNVLDFGRIGSNIRVQNEKQAAALANFEQQVLLSLEEVENAVVSYTRNVERREALKRAVDANRRSVELATGRFGGGQGVGDLLDVLVAQRDLFSAEDALVDSETQLSQNLVALYKSLGGGWETFPEPLPPPRKPGTRPSQPMTPTPPAKSAPVATVGAR